MTTFHISDLKGPVAGAVAQVMPIVGWERAASSQEADVVISASDAGCLAALKLGRHVLHVPWSESGPSESLKREYPQHYHPAPAIDPATGEAFLVRVMRLAVELNERGGTGQKEALPELSPCPVRDKRIVVVDDSPRNCASAAKQLGQSNEVTTFTSYKEMLGALANGKLGQVDILLCDMLMPAEADMLSPKAAGKFVGQQMAIGDMVAMAAARANIPLIMIQTDAGHHDHPALALLDDVGWDLPIRMGKSTVIFTRAATVDGVKDWGLGMQGHLPSGKRSR